MRYAFNPLSYAIAAAMVVLNRKPKSAPVVAPPNLPPAAAAPRLFKSQPAIQSGASLSSNLPKRVRPPRTAPLTAADIVEGGTYVPKRGNNKTPNLVVEGVSESGQLIAWRRTCDKPGDVSGSSLLDFLSYVARRVEA